MSIEIRLPNLGDGIDSGDVLEVLVREGDQITKEQGIIELETDKATVEVPSTHAGTVTKLHVEAGQTVAVGAVLITLEPAEPAPAVATAPTAEAAPAVPAAPEPPASAVPDSSQAPGAVPPQAPAAPPASPRPAVPVSPSAPGPAPAPAPESSAGGSVPAGPAVRRFARELGVDLAGVIGTGPGGRITRHDVKAAVRQAQAAAVATPVAAAEVVPTAQPGDAATDAWGPIRVERMPKIRRTIAAQMHKSWTTCPRVTNFDDADITELEHIRQSSKDDYSAQGIKLTSMTFVIKAVATSLKRHPLLNASIDMDNGTVTYKDYVNIGIAVDTDRGLVVPTLRNADALSIPEIARQLASIARAARTNSFAVEDLRGGTFTISNLGAVGGAYSTPIVNVPEVAILLLGRARKRPVVTEHDEIAVRLMLPLSLSYDHRLVDGAAAARFLSEVISLLQAPSRLVLAP